MPPAEPKHNWKISYGFVSHIARESFAAREKENGWECVRVVVLFGRILSARKSLARRSFRKFRHKSLHGWSKNIAVK